MPLLNGDEPTGFSNTSTAALEDIRGLIRAGQPTRAFELARQALMTDDAESAAEYQYLAALALARGGNDARAESMVAELLTKDLSSDLLVKALSLNGRIFKDRYRRATGADSADRRSLAKQSAELYQRAYELTGDSFPGINTATMWRLAGNQQFSSHVAEAVEKSLSADEASNDDYWTPATRAEARLLREDLVAAEADYAIALERAAGQSGDVAAIRRQVRLLAEVIDVPSSLLQQMAGGSVVVFSGHMIDHPDRPSTGRPPRFPASPDLEKAVREAIEQRLESLDTRIGFSSAACGADLIFAETLLDRGGELHVILPFDSNDFYRNSVDYGLEEMASWRTRCDTVFQRAEVHFATRENHLGDDFLYEFANHIMQGLAITRAEELCLDPVALVVADLAADGAAGGTLDFLRLWERGGRRAEVIELASLRDRLSLVATETDRHLPTGDREIKSMLFADVKGYSALRENQTPVFFAHFLHEVAETLRTQAMRPLFQNTWGDGLFLVFEEPAACADFALSLQARIAGLDFRQWGLPGDMSVRIAIHAGPVFRQIDPIIARENFFGSHVNRTARIEPVTMPGCIYASEQMAALLALENADRYHCEYVGSSELAKGFDRCPLYHITRTST